MSRDRMTGGNREAADVLAKIQALEKQINAAADDAGITQEAEAIAKEEKEVVKKNVPGVVLKDEGDQNAKANKNWPLTAQEKEVVASALVNIAKALLKK